MGMIFYQNHPANDCKRKKKYSEWLANGGNLKLKAYQNKVKRRRATLRKRPRRPRKGTRSYFPCSEIMNPRAK
jgi:hypothetical protein